MGDKKLALTIPEAAIALGISNGMVRKLARTGALPTVHLGRSVRVPVDALRVWMEQRTEVNAEIDGPR